MTRRTLIVNADDFGQSHGITRGIIEAHERGIVTSASLMVLWPAADSAAAYARTDSTLSVGLHVDLGEWVYRHGGWQDVYARADLRDPGSVERQVRLQLERCRDLLGRNPSHLDSHQHVHRGEPARSILLRLAGELNVPLRHLSPAIRHYGGFYGQTATGGPLHELIGVSHLVACVAGLPDGVTELGCHPGYPDDLDTIYSAERAMELHALCDADVRQALVEEDIRLASFVQVATT